MREPSNPPRDGEGDRRPKAGGGGGRGNSRRPTVYTARKLRRAMSLPEVLLWQRIRGSAGGVSFRKQHPIDPYVVDFYCSGSRLIVEVDGQAHDRGDRPQRDERRDAFLRERGYRLLRIAASDVLKDPDGVAEAVVAAASDPLHHRASRGGPPPRAGEDHDA
ncbi:MAG TPA: endonuclease domain-containing protein [Allosphingosinicella sp.]